ncbi:MAG: hypothetical protein ACK4E3_03475 [Brevundimonas sp.]|uniref:hypothetical protein n=1 Tax=Brevundimonas sp. TaxID=1871086 RepID=UPI0039188843
MRVTDLPFRLTTAEVCALAGWSRRTLQRKRAVGEIDLSPIDRGRQDLFARADVIRALNLKDDDHGKPTEQSWEVTREQLDHARSGQIRRHKAGPEPAAKEGRHAPGIFSGAGKTPALRLACDNTAAIAGKDRGSR